MDEKNVLNINKDASLCSSSKASDSKNTKVFVLPPELLKGLLLENKLPKLNLLNKNESPTVVDRIKNAQPFAKNISNEVKVQKLTNNIRDIKKTVDSTEQVVEKLNIVESQLQNGTLHKSAANKKELSLKNEEINKFNDNVQEKILNKNTRKGRKKLDRDKELKDPETSSKTANDFSKEKEIRVLKDNQNSSIVKVYRKRPRISQNKVIKNTFTNDVQTDCDNIYNKETAKSSNSSERISDSCVEEKDQESTVQVIDKELPIKSSKSTNPAEFLNNKDALNSSNITIKNKDTDTEILSNDVNPNVLNIKNAVMVFDTNLQTINSDLMEEQFCEEHTAEKLLSSPEENIQIKKEIIAEDEVGEITDEIIIIEETIEEIVEFYDFDTDKNASTEIEESIENSENLEWSNDNRDNQPITKLDSTKNESDTSNSIVVKESFENINPINDETKINDRLKKDEIPNDVDEVLKTIQKKVQENCESFLSEDTSKVNAKKENHDSHKMDTKLIENPVAAAEQSILNLTLPSENVNKMEALNTDEQSDTVHSEIKSHEKKDILLFPSKTVVTKTEIESTENLEVSTNVSENKDSIRRSTRLPKNLKRYKPVINNCKRKQTNSELKENKKRIDDSLNEENSSTNELAFNKETVNERIISQVKKIKEPVFDEKNETNITSDDIDSKCAEEKKEDKILFSKKLSSANDSNENILGKECINANSLKKSHQNYKISSYKGNKSTHKSIAEYKINTEPLNICESEENLAKCIKLSSTLPKEKSDAILLHERNENITVDEEIPSMISEIQKQEITKMNVLIDGNLANVSKTVENVEIISKYDLPNSFSQEKYGITESQNETVEVQKNPVIDVPINNYELIDASHYNAENMHTDEVKENQTIDVSINSTVSDESMNDVKTQEINDHNLMESFEKCNKNDEMLNNITEKNVKSDISRIEAILKDNVICTAEENLFNKNDENCLVNEDIPNMTLEFQKQEIIKDNTELTNEIIANISTTLEDTENVDSKSDFSDTFDQETYGAVESQSSTDEIADNLVVGVPENYDEFGDKINVNTDEVRDYPADDILVNNCMLSDKSCNDAKTQKFNDHNLVELFGKSKKIDEIFSDMTDNNLQSGIINKNVENVLKDNVTYSVEENIFEKSNENDTVNDEISKFVSKDEKQEITKMNSELLDENHTNFSEILKDMETVNSKSDFSHIFDQETVNSKSDFSGTFDQETYGVAESKSDTDEIKDNQVVDVPVSYDELTDKIHNDAVNINADEVNCILSEESHNDIPVNSGTLLDESHNNSVTQEMNDCNLLQSVETSKKIEEILNDEIATNLKSDMINTNAENFLKDNATCSVKEKIFDKSDENCTFNAEISSEFEILSHGTCTASESQKNTDIIKENAIFENPVFNDELSDANHSEVIHQELNDQNLIEPSFKDNKIEGISSDAADNNQRPEANDHNVETSNIEIHENSHKKRNKKTAKSYCDLKKNTRRSSRISSVVTSVNINSPETSSIVNTSTELFDSSCKDVNIDEIANQKLHNTMTDNENHQVNEIPKVPKRKGRKGPPKATKILENNSIKFSENDDKVNNDADNQINKVTDPQEKTSKEANEEENSLNLSTNHLSDNSDKNLNTPDKSIVPIVVQKRKRGRVAKSKILKEDSNIENSENDLNIETNSESNIVQRRSRRLTAARSISELKTKDNKRNTRKSSREIGPSEVTESNKVETVADFKEVQTRKRKSRSKSKTSESNEVEEKLDEKISLEYKNLSEKGDSNSNLLKMENSNKDNSDVKDDIETADHIEAKTEEQIPNLKNVEKKRRGRPPKSAIAKTTITSVTNYDKKANSLSKTVNSKPTGLNDSQIVEEDSVNLGKRKRRSRYDRSSEFDSQVDLELETSKNELKNSRKRKRRSRFDKSTESNSQEEDLEMQTSTNESEHEKTMSGESDNNDENRYDRPRRKRRKRGRPAGRSISKYDDDYAPHHSQVQRSPAKETNKRKSITSDQPEQKETVICGKCGRSMTKNQWANHNLSTHNNLGWLEGTVKPDYDNDEKLAARVLARVIKKRKSLICEKCGAIQRSVPGHLSHVLFCGKSEDEVKALMITCPGCNAVIKPSSLEYHERLHQKQTEEKPKITIEIIDEITDSGMKSKRKAAEKAVTKISEIVTLTKADQDDGTLPLDKKIKLNDLKKIIQKPKITKKIPGLLQSKWQKSIDAGEDAACCQVGCTLTFKTLDEIKQHYSTCNFTPEENFVCRICKYQSKLKNEMIQHAIESHAIEDEDEKAYVSDSDYSSESDFEDSVIKISIARTPRSSKRISFAERNDPLNKKFKFLFKDGVSYTKYNKTFLTGFRWTLEFEEKNYSFNLFDDYTPNTFQLLEKEESKQYYPKLKESMPMTSFKKENKKTEWKTWKIFEGQCFDDFPTFFAGGSIWALAWLPIPSFLCFSGNITQFVAISTHPTMDKEYSIGEMYSGKNIIQIWNMGDLNHDANNMSDPKLAYAIVHDGGTVWCLEWCPSGCYDHEDLPGFVEKENKLRRMGLLAAACSDGSIRVYSLIFPEDLPSSATKKDEETDECLVYKTDPVLMLVVNRKMFDNKQQNWQVTKLSWTKERGHNVIVAGFSNGYVALWDLTTKSPMLKCKRDNTIFLNPFKHFLAHLHSVTKVYLIPYDNKRYLVTTSLDRHYKFWDLEDVTNPRTNLKKTYVTDASWFNHWNCVLLSGDDALSMRHNYTHCRPVREHMYRYYNVLPSNSTTFSVDTSDFGNSIANGTLAGEVLAIFPQQMMYINDMKKSIPRKRYFSIVSSVEVVDFQETKKKESANVEANQEEYNYMPSTYEGSKDRFGLKFCDKLSQLQKGYTKVSGINPKKTLTCEMMQTVPTEQYPFMSVNRVSWNPNCWSFLWLAVGYQNGFVRFIPIKSMASTNEWNKMLTDHIKRLKARSDTVDVDR